MPSPLLVTGGTGTLGRPTVDLLRASGRAVRVLSRTAGEGRVVGDLRSGEGLPAALEGIGAVLHLASDQRHDVEQTRRLLAAAESAGLPHLVYVSIVGIDRIPFPYYRAKLECERLIEASPIPSTILRATQFHEFVARLLDAQRRLPVVLVLPIDDQPIAAREVGARLAELAAGSPAGRVADLGGPEKLPLRELAALWQRARGIRRPQWTIRLPGRTMAAFRAGHHLTEGPGEGRETFAEFLARRATNDA